ncbi:hypothetical protein K456DRAFT_29416 [Colletotrichum gloeosporioides 23]|nr:hypothetical protein K456DRAFT_29416 [Colletotrichum gloeosporioides 23]
MFYPTVSGMGGWTMDGDVRPWGICDCHARRLQNSLFLHRLSLTTTGISFANSAPSTKAEDGDQSPPPSPPQRPIVVIYSLTPSYSPLQREKSTTTPNGVTETLINLTSPKRATRKSEKTQFPKRKQGRQLGVHPEPQTCSPCKFGQGRTPSSTSKGRRRSVTTASKVHRTIRQPRRDVVFGSPLSKVYYVWNKKSSRPFLVYTVENHQTNQPALATREA